MQRVVINVASNLSANVSFTAASCVKGQSTESTQFLLLGFLFFRLEDSAVRIMASSNSAGRSADDCDVDPDSNSTQVSAH